MEVVLLLLAIAGIALIAVPRLRARRAGAASRRRSSRRKNARVVTRAAAVTPVAASWTPPAAEEDAWDDDLGWEGQDATPATRDEWNKWRDEQSPETESPELPSVDRWRDRAASGDDGLEDDDGLGWEGTGLTPPSRSGRVEPGGSPPSAGDIAAARQAEAARNGEAAPSRNGVFAASNGHADLAPAPTGLASPGDGAAASDGLASPDNGTVTRTFGRPDALASPEASNGGGSRGRDWLTPGARANGEATPAPAPAPRRRRSIHPVVLVALYAAAGIGAVVLASTVLLGGSSSPSKPAPKATAAPPASTPAPTPTPTVDTSAKEAADAAAAKSAERRQIAAFRKQRAAARHAEAVAIAKARAAAKRRKEAQQRKQASGSGGSPTVPTQPTTPQSSGGGRSSGGSGGGGGRTCEFCIG